MSTRAQIRFATREAGQSFNQHPSAIHAQFYKHSDGYPEGLGLDIAESIYDNSKLSGWEIEGLGVTRGDLEYIYYIWQARGKETFISIFQIGFPEYCNKCNQYVGNKEDKCIFVGNAEDLINKYSQTKNES